MTQPTVFISYSHQDEPWKDRLVTHLGVGALAVAAACLLSPRRSVALRVAGGIGVAAWMVSVALPVVGWLRSGEPREAGSWRGSWRRS